jgi:hypothetical protein
MSHLYMIYTNDINEVVSICAGLMKQGIAFRAGWCAPECAWAIELTGAY